MHCVQDLACVGKSVENIHPDEITLEAIDNANECAKNKEAFIKQSKTVSAAGDPGKFIRVNNGSPGVIVLSIIYFLS